MFNYLSQSQGSPYLIGIQSFISELMPSDAMKIPSEQVIYILGKKLGHQFYDAFNPEKTIDSPLKWQNTEGGQWLKKVNMVGINVRTIQSFWNVVKYSFTLSEAQSSVHLLPIWEPGVVASLYGMSSWNINPEFFSEELRQVMPHLDTVEKQLKVVINILHGLGKSVGMDVIPHTDRYSEQVLANPQNFEWLQRIDFEIVKHDNNLHETVQELIYNFLKKRDPSVNFGFEVSDFGEGLTDSASYFFENIPESDRLKMMFGEPADYEGRLKRRAEMIQFLYDNHYEPVPATMGPPYRGLKVDENSEPAIDQEGRIWRDYLITKPEKFSRVFGPLTRYKLFENKNNNADWAIDFDRPIHSVFEYAAQHYTDVQATYNIDFMRGDMAHVQVRPEGVPLSIDEYYDVLKFIKYYIANKLPYFGSFAETFLAPAGEMAYGDEVEHLEASDADSTLGDLQSMVVGSPRFLGEFRRYLDILYTRKVAPSFTIMTGDKDDPRFDEFYLKGNEARFFISLFLTDMPSYMGLGFEQRDAHPTPAPNEHYTKLYVFRIEEGEKETHGNYVWGQNKALFSTLNKIKIQAESILKNIQNAACEWIALPDVDNKVIAWTQKDTPQYFFIVNLDIDDDLENVKIKSICNRDLWGKCFKTNSFEFQFSTHNNSDNSLIINDLEITIAQIKAGEGRVYKLK